MDSLSITRVMIEHAVDRGLQEMEDDPKRAIRKMADLGRQFSTGRFNEVIYGIFTKLIEDENSAYYTLMNQLLDGTDHGMLKRFCINVGYDSWTYGARTLRAQSEKLGMALPFAMVFHYNAANETGCGMTAARIGEIVRESHDYGLNTYAIIQEGTACSAEALMPVFRDNPHSGFFYFLDAGDVTSAQIHELLKLGNVVISVNAESPHAAATCAVLKACGLLYAVHRYYDEAEAENPSEAIADKMVAFGSSFVFALQKDDCRISAGAAIRRARMEQAYPCFIWDLYGDIEEISGILVDRRILMTVDADGSVRCLCDGATAAEGPVERPLPEKTGCSLLDSDVRLEEVFRKCL